MTPLFFGPAETPLYGVYHPPKENPREAGVVLCYPFGQEYMRAHRAYRQLALLLTRKGYHVLRFDYRGTGDSSGDMTGVVAEDWVADVGYAISELRDVAGVTAVSVVGLRLGALVAAAACSRRDDVERLIVWDPLTAGAAYEAELTVEIAAEVSTLDYPSSGNANESEGSIYYNGFELPQAFRKSLRALDLQGLAPQRVDRVLQVVSHETPAFSRLRSSWESAPNYRYIYAAAPHDWNYVDNFGGILLPQPVIQAIVNWMV